MSDRTRQRKAWPVRAVTIQRFGDPSGMAIIDAPVPIAGRGQVIIETAAIGVGGVDAMIRRGTLADLHPVPAGLIPGSEVVGISGGYSEVAVARIVDVAALPDELSFIDAVTVGSAGPVAHYALAQSPRFEPAPYRVARAVTSA